MGKLLESLILLDDGKGERMASIAPDGAAMKMCWEISRTGATDEEARANLLVSLRVFCEEIEEVIEHLEQEGGKDD